MSWKVIEFFNICREEGVSMLLIIPHIPLLLRIRTSLTVFATIDSIILQLTPIFYAYHFLILLKYSFTSGYPNSLIISTKISSALL
jgi:hypothetical protein